MATIDDVIEEHRGKLHSCGLTITKDERLKNNHGHQLRTKEGPIVNIFDNGTIQFQGGNQHLLELEFEVSAANRVPIESQSRKVFVVYGHDPTARVQLEAMLLRWKLEPLLLDQLASEGQTIIEKLERYQNEASFAVVLATPDDVGHPVGRPDESALRARQNVVLELGMMLTRLGRSKVAILMKATAEMERPSDIQGLIYIPFTDNVNDIGLVLAKEMNKQGLKIDLNRI